MTPERELEPTPPIADLRDRLGEYLARADQGTTVPITDAGRSAGALVPTEQVVKAGLPIAGAVSLDHARKHLGPLRTAAHEQGPQAITARTGADAVLVSVAHAALIAQGRPVLMAAELHFDGQRITDQDGNVIAPGSYSYAGGILHVPAPETPETTENEGETR